MRLQPSTTVTEPDLGEIAFITPRSSYCFMWGDTTLTHTHTPHYDSQTGWSPINYDCTIRISGDWLHVRCVSCFITDRLCVLLHTVSTAGGRRLSPPACTRLVSLGCLWAEAAPPSGWLECRLAAPSEGWRELKINWTSCIGRTKELGKWDGRRRGNSEELKWSVENKVVWKGGESLR